MSVNSSFDWSPGKANVQKTKRFRYSALEERKMLHFFANELRGGNLKVKFGSAIWDNYIKAFNKHTTRTSSGLESHFRKIMVRNLPKYYAELGKEDFFLLLRFFKVGLSVEQKRMLGKFLMCRLETDQDGCFLSACSEEPGDISIYPTREDRRKISILSMQEDVSDSDGNPTIENESSVEDQNQSNVQNDVEEEERFDEVVVLKRNLSSNITAKTVNNKAINQEKGVVISKLPDTKGVPRHRSVGIQCSDAPKRESLGIQCGASRVRVPSTSFSSSSTSASSNSVESRETRLRNLKRKLMRSLVNVLEGSENVDCFLDSIPQDRRNLFEQPREQLEWIICDHDSSPSKKKKTH